jgi:hypothetical protein
VISNQEELIGGSSALGAVGDILLENDQIRIIIQDAGFSRGNGIYGGQIIDVDRRRVTEAGDTVGGNGMDAFGELFPALFLQAVAVDNVEILSDGSDGSSARVSASGYGGDIFSFLAVLDRVIIGSHADTIQQAMAGPPYIDDEAEPQIRYETVYELVPGESVLDIHFSVTNISEETLQIPGQDATALLSIAAPELDLSGFKVPVGDAALLGAKSPLFMPGYGFEQEFSLKEAYTNEEIVFPNFSGLVTEWVASHGDGVSYGIFIDESEYNYVYNKRALYEDERTVVTPTSLMLFIQASGLSGLFEFDAPSQLEPGETWTVTKHLAVGHGDVGSVLDEIYAHRGEQTGRMAGQVIDEVTGAPVEDASVIVYQDLTLEGGEQYLRPYSQYDTGHEGWFQGDLAPGDYSLRISGEGRMITDPHSFIVTGGETTGMELVANAPGHIVVSVRDSDGRQLPARVTAVGTYGAEYVGQEPREFLYDMAAGESFRITDMVQDSADDPETRRYIESVTTTHHGISELLVRPGTYEIFTSRGPEYDLQSTTVTVSPGDSVSVTSTLTRVLDTTGWIAADFHVHTANSADSSAPLAYQVNRLAAEGIEWAVATDHNFVTDLAPTIWSLGLEDWMISSPGLELTTLDSGHFNGFPLRYEVGPSSHGSFEWAMRPPDEIFDELRSHGAYGPENTVVQVNHPRDTVLGYFNQHRIDGLSTEIYGLDLIEGFLAESGAAFYDEEAQPTFSLNFDALEVFNGNRIDVLHHYRVPAVIPQDADVPEDLPPAGSILLDSDGEVAFPGAIDDWFNFLNLGERFIGTGASDTHGKTGTAGYARTMIYTGEDNPVALEPISLVQAMRERRVVATNGALLDFYINNPIDGAMGQTIHDEDGQFSMTVHLSAPSWMSVSRVNVIRNGLVLSSATIEVDPDRDLSADPLNQTLELEVAIDDDGEYIDTWVALEAIGYRSLFPVVWPYEKPSAQISDAVGTIAEPLGFDNEFGDLGPALTFPVAAYAVTNPTWIIVEGDAFTPPGVAPTRLITASENNSGLDQNPVLGYQMYIEDGALRLAGSGTPTVQTENINFHREPRNSYDIRRILNAFHGHSH